MTRDAAREAVAQIIADVPDGADTLPAADIILAKLAELGWRDAETATSVDQLASTS